jgi:regulator of extracellular matrix RemA (YlzA/DUF370 family)
MKQRTVALRENDEILIGDFVQPDTVAHRQRVLFRTTTTNCSSRKI